MMHEFETFSELDEKQVDDIWGYSRHYSDMGMQRVKDKVMKGASGGHMPAHSKFLFRRRLAASVAAVLIISAIAVKANEVGLRQLLHSFWGNGSELVAKYVEDINQTAHYNGLELNLLGAYREDDNIAVIYSLTDMEADRIGGENHIGSSFSFALAPEKSPEDEPAIRSSVLEERLLDYNADTRTATYVKSSSIGGYLDFNDEAMFSIKQLQLGREEKVYAEKTLDLYALLKEHTAQAAAEKEKVFSAGGTMLEEISHESGIALLEKDELYVPFEEIGWTHISNIGFVDGRLHIQTKPQDITDNRISQMRFVDRSGNVVYGGEADRGLSISHGLYGDGASYGMYHEYIFDSIAEPEQIKDLYLEIGAIEYLETMKDMDFSVTFQIPEEMPKIEIPVSQKVKIYNEVMEQGTLILTPLYLKLTYITENPNMFGNVPNEVYITYRDGSRAALEAGTGGKSMIGQEAEPVRYLTFAKFENGIIDMAEVRSIHINGQEFIVGA